MQNIESLKRNEIVTLNRDCSPMSGDVFKAGDTFKFLGWYGGFGNLARLSRVSDHAKLTVLPKDIGYCVEQPEPTAEEKETMKQARAEEQAKQEARETHYAKPHSDASGASRFIETHSILAGEHSGTFGFHATPAEEREYNDGMAKMAAYG